MRAYAYRAVRSGTQKKVKGRLDAVSESSVVARLHAQGLVPLEVTLVPQTGLHREISFGGGRQVDADALALFARQMSSLVGAGLPLMRVLAIMVDQTENRLLRRALESVRADVESGVALSPSLAKHPRVFPPLLISLVRVGESGGFLDESLASIATLYQSEAELRGRIRSATTYPMVVLVVAVIALIAMVTFIVPVFKDMFSSMGGELPLPTQILVTLSENMIWILPLLLVLVVAAGIWWAGNRNTPAVRRVIDPLKLKLPVVGPLMTKIAVARFARNLSMMLQAGVPLLSALETVSLAADNAAIEDALNDVRESVRGGKSFAGPLERSGVFPAMVSQMVAVGEESGTLPDMLVAIADFYETEARTATEQLTSVIEPLLIVVLGVLIGGMVVALYMPIFGLYEQLDQTG